MGIDVYLKWKNMFKADKEAQITSFDVFSGHVGYLREAYHGNPYATKYMFSECFENKSAEFSYPASLLEERLEETLRLVVERASNLYDSTPEEIEKAKKSFVDFVALAKTIEEIQKEPCVVAVSY